ncbi:MULTISPECIES: hypothetical protein [unclassified Streptomyces]
MRTGRSGSAWRGGVWKRERIEAARINAVQFSGLDMARIVVAADPTGGD